MKSKKCGACGFVGWSDLEYCKSCGAPLNQQPSYQWDQQEGDKKGMAIVALVLGILSSLTFGLLGVGAVVGIILAYVAMGRIKREPWIYGGRGLAIAGLVLNVVGLVSVVPIALIAAIAIPNLLASRIAANEGAAIYSMRQIASAESIYRSQFLKYGTLDELAAQNLIDPRLASGTKSGYKFTVEVTSYGENVEGFAVVGVPITYQSSGRRSFYIDETNVMRASDNRGGPSSKLDVQLESYYDYPSTSRRRSDYQPQNVY